MVENLATSPAESAAAVGASEEQKNSYKFPSKTKDFSTGLFFGLAGAILLALVDLLLVEAVNSGSVLYEKITNLLVILGPLLLLGFFMFSFLYFFKKRRYLSYGLVTGFSIFLCLLIFMIKIIL